MVGGEFDDCVSKIDQTGKRFVYAQFTAHR